jgi:hypothetical protein
MGSDEDATDPAPGNGELAGLVFLDGPVSALLVNPFIPQRARP